MDSPLIRHFLNEQVGAQLPQPEKAEKKIASQPEKAGIILSALTSTWEVFPQPHPCFAYFFTLICHSLMSRNKDSVKLVLHKGREKRRECCLRYRLSPKHSKVTCRWELGPRVLRNGVTSLPFLFMPLHVMAVLVFHIPSIPLTAALSLNSYKTE